jgi:hypothetical protein
VRGARWSRREGRSFNGEAPSRGHPSPCAMVWGLLYPRTFHTDLNGLICKAFEAELTLVRQGHFRAGDAVPPATPQTRRHWGHPSRGKAFSWSARSANRALDGG